MQKTIQKYIIHNEKELDDIDITLERWDRIFFIWDLGAGKSTFIRHILRKHINDPTLVVRSPTYTYYQQYTKIQNSKFKIQSQNQWMDAFSDNLESWINNLESIFHMDLYRLEDYDTFISIGGEEILSDTSTMALIEWPEILWDTVQYTKKISIKVMENGGREITLES